MSPTGVAGGAGRPGAATAEELEMLDQSTPYALDVMAAAWLEHVRMLRIMFSVSSYHSAQGLAITCIILLLEVSGSLKRFCNASIVSFRFALVDLCAGT